MATESAARPAAAGSPALQSIASLTYNNIRAGGLGDLGQFRTMKEKFGWRVRKTVSGVDAASRTIIQYAGTDVASASWVCSTGKEYELKIVMNDGEIIRFDGFKESDFEPLARHIKRHWGLDVQKTKKSTKGWHWGAGQIGQKSFSFIVDNRPAFDLSSSRISQVAVSKGDVSIVIENDENRGEAEDQLIELRLFIPPSKTGDEDSIEAARQALVALPGVSAGPLLQVICMFTDVKVLVPAGRFDIQVFPSSMKLLGKSSDFTLEFKVITRMYLLPAPAGPHTNLVISLSSPLRKGHTPYHNVVFQFDTKKVIDLQLSITAEDIAAMEEENPQNKEANLTPAMTGNEYELAARVLKKFIGKPMLVPGIFRSSTGQCCFRYEDIVTVSLGRTSGSQTKLFEFDVTVKGGQMFSFSSVDRQESGPFLEFLQSNNITVRSLTGDDNNDTVTQSILSRDLPSDDDSDEDFQAQSSDGEESSDSDNDDEDEEEEGTPAAKEKEISKKRKTTDAESSRKKVGGDEASHEDDAIAHFQKKKHKKKASPEPSPSSSSSK